MRGKDEVRSKFDDLRKKRLSQRKNDFLSRSHINCMHNVRLTVKGNGKCGFCRHPEIVKKANGKPFVCDEEGTAKRCKFFDCRNTPKTVEDDFEEILSSPSRCGNTYPKLAMMIWFLQGVSTRTRFQRFKVSLMEVLRSLSSFVMGRWW
jgi:hypothetical protein